MWTPEGLYFGTGNSGKLGRIEKDQDLMWVKEDLESQVLSLVRGVDGELLIGTGGEGRVVTMGKGYAKEGTYLSQVYDGGFVSKFGAISWQGRKPADTEIEVTTRSGNTATVDESWSDFSKAYTDQEGSQITNPAARYVQYRVIMTSKTGTNSPELEQMKLAYLQTNQPPRVTDVVVTGGRSADGGGEARNARTQQRGRDEAEAGKHTIAWKAEDSDGDKMEFAVSFRGENEELWKTLKDKTEEFRLSWDTTAVPDGYYRVRVWRTTGCRTRRSE